MEDQLRELECPFNWNIPKLNHRESFLKNLGEIEDQANFILNGFCVFLLECFERARGDEIQLAIKKSKECEVELSEYYPVGRFSVYDKYVLERSSDALWHTLLATQAYLAFLDDDISVAEMKIAKIVPVKSFNESNMAALWGIKSRFFQGYGGEGDYPFEAIACARKAVELDDSVPLWHFLLGKSVARYRRNRYPYELPPDEERDELEKAWEKCKKPDFGVMLLQTYQGVIKGIKRHWSGEYANLKQRIQDTINDIKENAGNEWYIYWRCAHVCLRLPRGIVSSAEIKYLIDRAMEFSESNHNENKKHLWEVMATYYKIIYNDQRRALQYYERAATAGESTCAFDVFSISYRIDRDRDLIPIIDDYIELFSQNVKLASFYIIRANYLFFVKGDIKEAFKIYLDVMKDKSNAYQLLKTRPMFNESRYNYSLYEKLKDELNYAIQRSNSPDEVAMLKDYLKQVCYFENQSLPEKE